MTKRTRGEIITNTAWVGFVLTALFFMGAQFARINFISATVRTAMRQAAKADMTVNTYAAYDSIREGLGGAYTIDGSGDAHEKHSRLFCKQSRSDSYIKCMEKEGNRKHFRWNGMNTLQGKAFPVFTISVIILLIVPALIGLVQSQMSTIPSGTSQIGTNVESYRTTVTNFATQYQMSDYVGLILAVMQQESGGQGGDPMQAAEGPFNTRYPHEPGGITDPTYSIECGIQELKSNLQAARCSSPLDMPHLELALQGYNFGTEYITWATPQGGYSQANAAAFSRMEAAQMGWASYGDPDYVPHVLRYYKVF